LRPDRQFAGAARASGACDWNVQKCSNNRCEEPEIEQKRSEHPKTLKYAQGMFRIEADKHGCQNNHQKPSQAASHLQLPLEVFAHTHGPNGTRVGGHPLPVPCWRRYIMATCRYLAASAESRQSPLPQQPARTVRSLTKHKNGRQEYAQHIGGHLSMAIRGTCLCGGITFEIDRAIGPAEFCHCNRCRKVSGSTALLTIRARVADYRLLSGREMIRSYAAPILYKPPPYQSTFCSRCGSPVPEASPQGEFMEIPAGVFDDDPGIRPDKHIFVEFIPAWDALRDELPAYTRAEIYKLRAGYDLPKDFQLRWHASSHAPDKPTRAPGRKPKRTRRAK
jgi:hypothetical protein